METSAREAKPEKTPGDLRREEIANNMGQGWQFFKNYPVIPQESIEYFKEGGVGGITTSLELQKQHGEIEDWRAEKPAFNDIGKEIPFSQGRAAYIKPKPQTR